jgi:CRP/FNR family transcriptional regulator, cyclic AMP receptor protein
VRQRVARHRAIPGQPGAELVAVLSQQQLADAVGTVREVVVRTLRELRQSGVIETGRHNMNIAGH